MRIIDRLREPVRAVTVPNESMTWLTSTYSVDDTRERVDQTFASFAADGYKGNAIVFALIAKRIALFSQAEFKWQNLTDKSLYGNADLDILEHPWPGATTSELLARMEQDVSLSGNSFIALTESGSLARLRPDWVTIVTEVVEDSNHRTHRQVLGYAFTPGGAGSGEPVEVYGVDEVAHFSPTPDPLASFRGMSWLTPVVREINADQAMTDHKQAFFDNAATPNLIVKYATTLNAETAATIADRFAARFAGRGNVGKTIVLDGGADLTVVGNSFDQMKFTALQAAGENRIAAASGVPGIVAGLKEGLSAATYSNYEQAQRNMSDLTACHWWQGAASSLSKLVAVPAGARLWYDKSAVPALRQGEKDRAETVQIQAAAALNLINAGYDAATVASALTAGDLTLLKHTGLVPTLLTPPGQNPNAPTGSAA